MHHRCSRIFSWKLISNMSLNYLYAANIESAQGHSWKPRLARHYDQHAAKVSSVCSIGLQSIGHGSLTVYIALCRISRCCAHRIWSEYDGLSWRKVDLFLFASILSTKFFALYASLNSYHELDCTQHQGRDLPMDTTMGKQPCSESA